MFGSRLPLVEAYVELLATAGTERGLIGPREVPRLWDRHVLNCALLTDLIGTDRSVADVGSGAGLPGVVLALRRPDLSITLIEPLLRRTTFLEEAVSTLGLDNVFVLRGRAEELAGSTRYDVVTSRAVARLETLLRWSLPLVADGGEVLALKGRTAAEEIESLGLSDQARRLVSVVQLGEPELVVPTTVVRVESELSRHIPWARSRGAAQRRHPGGGHRRRR